MAVSEEMTLSKFASLSFSNSNTVLDINLFSSLVKTLSALEEEINVSNSRLFADEVNAEVLLNKSNLMLSERNPPPILLTSVINFSGAIKVL